MVLDMRSSAYDAEVSCAFPVTLLLGRLRPKRPVVSCSVCLYYINKQNREIECNHKHSPHSCVRLPASEATTRFGCRLGSSRDKGDTELRQGGIGTSHQSMPSLLRPGSLHGPLEIPCLLVFKGVPLVQKMVAKRQCPRFCVLLCFNRPTTAEMVRACCVPSRQSFTNERE